MIRRSRTTPTDGIGVLAFTGLMALLAGGMWTKRYIAVLAFEGLLALAVLLFSLSLVEAANLEAALLCVGVIAGGGLRARARLPR